MRAGIVLFPGTNRERDVAIALAKVSGGREPVTIWHKETSLPPLDLVVLPGGFSHGDYLRCGAMAAQSPVMRAVRDFAEGGGHVLGVCNGFQILTEAALLPGALLRNAGLRFLGQDHHLMVEQTDSPYTGGYANGQIIRTVLAHGDGNYFADAATLDRLEGEGRVAFRYCDAAGAVKESTNPNGSQRNIAGIFSDNRRILGLMPHLEDYVDPLMGGEDGLPMFASVVERLAA
ncbi:MAG TPA: phosphoribosylformylglycinamidine synthase subunit PurQ [Acidisoma sp.]|nr:phosphoribosylformylglycinamidine synthase subunit PurQ [Acidisoma sp.]